jgi:hypothetical protein
MDPSACAFREAIPEPFDGTIFSSETARIRSTTLAHSSNCRLGADCVPPRRPKPGQAGVIGFAAGFISRCRYCSRVTN